jgi:hypothetical protein
LCIFHAFQDEHNQKQEESRKRKEIAEVATQKAAQKKAAELKARQALEEVREATQNMNFGDDNNPLLDNTNPLPQEDEAADALSTNQGEIVDKFAATHGLQSTDDNSIGAIMYLAVSLYSMWFDFLVKM